MSKIIKSFFYLESIFFSFLLERLGGFDLLLQALLYFMVMDFLSGIFKSILNKKLSSNVCFTGIFKKIMMLMILSIGVEMEKVMGNTIPLREVILIFYLTNEGLSILENLGDFIPLPHKLKEVFSQLKEDQHDV